MEYNTHDSDFEASSAAIVYICKIVIIFCALIVIITSMLIFFSLQLSLFIIVTVIEIF